MISFFSQRPLGKLLWRKVSSSFARKGGVREGTQYFWRSEGESEHTSKSQDKAMHTRLIEGGGLERSSTQEAALSLCMHRYTRVYRVCTRSYSSEITGKRPGAEKKKVVHIWLIEGEGAGRASNLEAAQRLAKRRDLRLLKVSDGDGKRLNPVYKLFSPSQLLGEDISHKKENKGKTGFKSEKIISFSANISEHDLSSKLGQVLKWIEKKHQVRVTISGSSGSQLAESLYEKIDAALKNNGRILQKRSSGSDIKFQVIPMKETKNEDKNDKMPS